MEKDKKYWDERYLSGDDSGHAARNSNEVRVRLGAMREMEGVESVLDVGCGDCRLLSEMLAIFKGASYIGLDSSEVIIDRNKKRFKSTRAEFKLLNDCSFDYKVDLVICFDVLFHITEDEDYAKMIKSLMQAWRKYLIIGTYNDKVESDNNKNSYIKVRKFDPSDFAEEHTEVEIDIDGGVKSLYIFKKEENENISGGTS